MKYRETAQCPVCESIETVTITAYGDYDGPSKPRKLNPETCKCCAGVKLTAPGLHAQMIRLYNLAEAAIASVEEETEKAIAREFNHFVDHHAAQDLLFAMDACDDRIFNVFEKELRIAQRDRGNRDSKFDRKTALKRALWAFLRMAKKATEDRNR